MSERWKDLFSQPASWTDCRAAKQEGRLNSRFPDFKHVSGTSLKLSRNTPEWAREELERGVPTWQQYEGRSPRKQADKNEPLWRSLFEEPGSWNDYREVKVAKKCHPRHPDFKPTSGEGDALWLENAPAWVLEKLSELDRAGGDMVNVMADMASKSQKQESLWRSLIDEPGLWTDYREGKQSEELTPRYPDFKRTGGEGESLWLDDRTPAWVLKALRDEASRSSAVAEEAAAVEEVAAVEEAVAVEEAAAVEETVAKKSKMPRKGTKASRSSAVVEEVAADEEAAAVEETVAKKGKAARKGAKALRSAAVVEEVVAIEEAAAIEETVAKESKAARKGTKASRASTVVEEAAGVGEAVAKESKAAREGTKVRQSRTLARQMWESLLNEPAEWIDHRPAKQAGNLTWDAADFENRHCHAKLWLNDPSIPKDLYDKLRNEVKEEESSGGMELATLEHLMSEFDEIVRQRRERRKVAQSSR